MTFEVCLSQTRTVRAAKAAPPLFFDALNVINARLCSLSAILLLMITSTVDLHGNNHSAGNHFGFLIY